MPFFQVFDQGRLGVTGGGWVKCCFRRQIQKFQRFADAKLGQLASWSWVSPFSSTVRYKGHEAGEKKDRPGGAEKVFAGFDIDRSLVINRRIHLAGHEPVPDELVKARWSGSKTVLPFGVIFQGSGPDRLVGFLGGFAAFIINGVFRR